MFPAAWSLDGRPRSSSCSTVPAVKLRSLILAAPFRGHLQAYPGRPVLRSSTWDSIRGDYGPDVETIDRAPERIFELVSVDPGRIAMGCFSDGASFALGLGLANGDLSAKIIAFSPGFVPPGRRVGRRGISVSHGDADDVLPIGRTSRRLVPALKKDGYDVTYREFKGPHTVPGGP